MDKLLEKIRKLDAEDLTDILEAVRQRHNTLYPQWELLQMTLPRNDPEEWEGRIRTALELNEKCRPN